VALSEREAGYQRSAKVQAALYQIADAASAATDMQAFYAALHRIVGGLMYAENFFIALYDAQSDRITWPYDVDTVEEASGPMRLADQHGVTGWILRHGKPVAGADGSFDSALQQGEAELVGARATDGIGIPLTSAGKTIGVLLVQSYKEEFKYTLQDIEVLNFVAQHISTALMRARALEETRQRNDELAIINSVQQGLASKLDFNSIIDLVGEKIREIFEAQVVFIAI